MNQESNRTDPLWMEWNCFGNCECIPSPISRLYLMRTYACEEQWDNARCPPTLRSALLCFYCTQTLLWNSTVCEERIRHLYSVWRSGDSFKWCLNKRCTPFITYTVWYIFQFYPATHSKYDFTFPSRAQTNMQTLKPLFGLSKKNNSKSLINNKTKKIAIIQQSKDLPRKLK